MSGDQYLDAFADARLYIEKYTRLFWKKFPETRIEVYFTGTALPPWYQNPPKKPAYGSFRRFGYRYVISIHELLKPTARLSSFFHEYGHAVYTAETNDDAIEGPAAIRSETAAMLSSLHLPDEEGLIEVAKASAQVIRDVANNNDEYRAAFEIVSQDPIWIKYVNI